jgi:outer membrane protein assembly factor BamD (BamD/ComL family)
METVRRITMQPIRMAWLLSIVVVLSVSLFCSKTLTEEELFTQAQAQLNGNNPAEAVQSYEEIIENYPESENRSKAVFMLGFLHANELNDTETARIFYTQMLREYPDHELIESVNFELANLGRPIAEIDSILVEKIEQQEMSTSGEVEKD